MRLEVAGDQFHCRDAARPDVGDEGFVRRKGGLRPPQSEPRRITEVGNVGSAGGRGVENPRARQTVLQSQPGHALLGALRRAARIPAADRVGHGVGLIERDHALEFIARPSENLFEPCVLRSARAKGGISDEENALGQISRSAQLPIGERLDVEAHAA